MRIYLIAGEASGDLHGSNLLREIRKKQPKASFRAWGGDLMQKQGAEIVKHYRELAFMGFTEVLMNLRTILRNLSDCEQDILAWKPDVVVLIDYPGFNLRIAKKLKQHGIKVFYYISPQVWAWKQSRVKTIRQVVDRMFVILPFEKEFYAKWNYDVDFVGHPLLDAIATSSVPDQSTFFWKREKPVIALLPGSRKQEISKMLPLMMSVRKSFPGYDFVIAGAPSMPESFYRSVLDRESAEIVFGRTYDVIRSADAALVTSGTATLETALLNTPEVVCYKGGKISYYIARSLIKVRFISLVNLIMDREVVKELIQDELNTRNLVRELERILPGGSGHHQLLVDYDALRNALGNAGASEKTADLMLKTLEQTR